MNILLMLTARATIVLAVVLAGPGASVVATLSSTSTPRVCPHAKFITLDRVTAATSIIGGISVLGCLLVLAVLLAYSLDRKSATSRILVGVFLANALYSLVNTVPLHYEHTAGTDCGNNLIDGSNSHWGVSCTLRGLWQGSKFMMVGYEIFIVGVTLAILRGNSINVLSPRRERICHCLCVGLGAVMFLGWLINCNVIHTTLEEKDPMSDDDYDYYTSTDTTNATLLAAQEVFNRDHTKMTRWFQLGWTTFLAVSVSIFIVQRAILHQLLREWQTSLAEAKQDWSRDLWNTSNPDVQNERDRKQKLRDLAKEAYFEVAAPLKRYYAVFLVFAVPDIVMATDWCAAQSTRALQYNSAPVACNAWCELVLAMRSLATVIAFFSHVDHRGYLRDWTTLVRRGQQRLKASLVCCCPVGDDGNGRSNRIQFHDDDRIEEVKLVNRIDVRVPYSQQPKLDDIGADGDQNGTVPASAVPYQLMEGD